MTRVTQEVMDAAKPVVTLTDGDAVKEIVPATVLARQKALIAEQAKIFKALGHGSRLLMVNALRGGELCVCDLQLLVGDDMSTVSRHLTVLREAGVVAARREGVNMYYRLELSCLESFLACTRTHVEQRLTARMDLLG